MFPASPYCAGQPDAARSSTQESVFPQPASTPVISAVAASTMNRRNTVSFLPVISFDAHVRVTEPGQRSRRLSGHDDHVGRALAQALAGFTVA